MAVATDSIAIFAALSPSLWAGIGLLLGAVVGSFLATVVTRWPKGEGAAKGRSHCDGCGAALGWPELVPLLSYALQRGRCRRCGAAIDPAHPAIELGCAAVGALSLLIHPGLVGLAGALFGWLLVALAVLDLRHFWLPDRLTLPLLALGLGASLLVGFPSPRDSLVGAAAGFLLLSVLGIAYRRLRGREGLGGGDSKLLAAIGAMLGWQFLPFVLLLASATGLVSVALGALRGRSTAATDRLPLGAFLAVAAWPLWLAGGAIALSLGF